MLFSSNIFVFLFLPIVFVGYYIFSSNEKIFFSKLWLIAAGFVFYAYWKVSYVWILVFSIVINYSISLVIINNNPLYKKKIFILGIIFNIGLLAFYKYIDFFIYNLGFILDEDLPLLHIALPLAISFFTFQKIAYLTDCYRGYIKRKSFLDYTLFIMFFPQLIAGPIVHYREMMPQFNSSSNLRVNYNNILLGLSIFCIGLFKKLMIADSFSIWVDRGFDSGQTVYLVDAWVSSLSYTFQIYFDFSGYTDMAIGLALLFNIRLPINFNSPYKSLNIQDFWRKWHITLSHFLRDYIYILLGGSYKGNIRTSINLLTTFLIGGLWHGASWMFVIWGLLHGIALVIYRYWKLVGFKLPTFLAWFLTFNFLNITWVFFRAKTLDDAVRILKGMFGLNGINLDKTSYILEVSWLGTNADWLYTYLPFSIIVNLVPIVAIICMILVCTRTKSTTNLYLEKDIYKISYWQVILFGGMAALALSKGLYATTQVFLYFNF